MEPVGVVGIGGVGVAHHVGVHGVQDDGRVVLRHADVELRKVRIAVRIVRVVRVPIEAPGVGLEA